MNDYLLFRKLIVPACLPILFLLGVALCVYNAIILFTCGGLYVVEGLITLIVGIPLVRVICEGLLFLARIAGVKDEPSMKMPTMEAPKEE
ncbi:MAG: hypothetical protein JW936_04200 [Sedimentisphaerales bacterium]|nr:hypothetical protein [Sedimentisphaerales bacterium]